MIRMEVVALKIRHRGRLVALQMSLRKFAS